MELLNTIETLAKQAITDQVFPGCVIGFVDAANQRIILNFGQLTYDKDAPLVKPDTLYDIASVTKSIPTSSLITLLIDQKKIELEDKLIDFIPELQNNYRNDIRIKHLLTYTLDFDFRTPFSAMKDKTADEILPVVFTSELKCPPGTKYQYSNAIGILIGLLAERIFGQTLDKAAQTQLFDPLEMTRTTFKPLEIVSPNEIAPTEIDDWRKREIRGEVHDESAYILQKKIIPGSAGLFTTANDLLNFISMLLNKGEYNRTRIYSPTMIELMYQNQLAAIHDNCGLGWALKKPYMGTNPPNTRFGRNGFTGCAVVCDVVRGAGLVILSNQTYPKRKSDKSAVDRFHAEIADLILDS